METTVHHIREGFDVYIGRAMPRQRLKASRWANPFHIGPDGTRDEVIAQYRQYLDEVLSSADQGPEWRAALEELRGMRLGCWCRPAACHGDVLVELLVELLAEGQAE
jgi:hypothetical protein